LGAIDRRALTAVATQFFVNGAVLASFLPRLPEIRDRVDISIDTLGVVMSAAAVFGFLGSVAVGPLIGRFQTRRVLLASAVVVALALPVLGIATSVVVLFLGLVMLSVFDVFVDVAMNMQGSWLSARRHAPVMNRLHGLWSLGTVVGGVVASRAAGAGVSLETHLSVAAVVLLGAVGFVSTGLLRADEDTAVETLPAASTAPGNAHEAQRAMPKRLALALFGLAGFFALMVEGTSNDWAAFRFTDDFGSTPGYAGLAFVAVTAGMTVGRFGGDFVAARTTAQQLLAASIGASGLGMVLATLVDAELVSFVGFALVGLGGATLLPTLYDRAARLPGPAGMGLGALTAGIRVAVLVAPVAVGALAATSLSVGAAVAMVALPSIAGFFLVTTALMRDRS
jgi:MFS family permease